MVNYKFLLDLLYGVFHDGLVYIPTPIFFIVKHINNKVSSTKNKTLAKIIIGLSLSLPLLFVVISLLSSADDIFKGLMDNISNLFLNLNLNTIILHLLIIVAVALLIFSYVWSLALNEKKQWKDSNLDSATILNKIDPVIIITILTTICLVYFIFIFIQFTYLFGSINYKLPTAFTYAEYARKGFFELVVITLINLSILLMNINFTENKEVKLNNIARLLNTFLVLCTTIMLFSAHFRMTLYEKVYGYTYLRFFTHSFMLYIFFLLLVVLIKIWYQSLSIIKLYVIISLTAYTLINYVNVDTLIANKNLDRYNKTGKLDVSYLSSLSFDAVPQMVNLYETLKIKDSKIAAELENQLYMKKKDLKNWSNWRSYNYSANKASKLLNKYDFKYNKIPSNDQ
jgi:hypothetical protein